MAEGGPDPSRRLGELFDADGHQLYLVGGAVRDQLLGLRSLADDIDLTTDARPQQILAIIEPIATAVWRQGERFGTIGATVFGRAVEITTYRSETYDDDSRKPVVGFGDDLETDLSRRDFSINAMARNALTGELVDPHDGRTDLEEGRIRTPLSAEISFTDDPLRILRAARFASRLDFVLDPSLVAAATELSGRVSIVSGERILAELERLLALPDPTAGLRFLWETGVLSESLDRAPLPGFDTVADAIARMPSDRPVDAAVRWASICHLAGVDADELASLLRMSNERQRELEMLVSTSLPDPADPVQVRRRLVRPGLASMERVIAVAQLIGSHETTILDATWRALRERSEREPAEALASPLDGSEVIAELGIDPGPEVGRTLAFLVESAIMEGPLTGDRARELARQFHARERHK